MRVKAVWRGRRWSDESITLIRQNLEKPDPRTSQPLSLAPRFNAVIFDGQGENRLNGFRHPGETVETFAPPPALKTPR